MDSSSQHILQVSTKTSVACSIIHLLMIQNVVVDGKYHPEKGGFHSMNSSDLEQNTFQHKETFLGSVDYLN